MWPGKDLSLLVVELLTIEARGDAKVAAKSPCEVVLVRPAHLLPDIADRFVGSNEQGGGVLKTNAVVIVDRRKGRNLPKQTTEIGRVDIHFGGQFGHRPGVAKI